MKQTNRDNIGHWQRVRILHVNKDGKEKEKKRRISCDERVMREERYMM